MQAGGWLYLKTITYILRRGVFYTALFSLVINLLMLVSPLYMLQIYDRVLTSGSRETLMMLSGIALFLLLLLAGLEIVRSRLLIRIGVQLNDSLRCSVFEGLFSVEGERSHAQPLRDLDLVRQFISSPVLTALFDAPWTPIFIGVIFLMHPLLGMISLLGALLIMLLAIITEAISRAPLREAAEHNGKAYAFVESSLRNVEVLTAMGMRQGVQRQWLLHAEPVVVHQALAGERVATLLGISKSLRLILQGAILGAGAWLVLDEAITPGVMIAASIVMGRALAPIEQAIGGWRQFLGARSAWHRTRQSVLEHQQEMVPLQQSVELSRPSGTLSVSDLTVTPPGGDQPLLQDISLQLQPGESLAVVGASGSGKSTLARLLVGVRKPSQGEVRLDHASVSDWDRGQMGQYIGYLPQDVELFDGSVAQNIARFGEIDSDAILQVSQLVGCHEMILQLPQGYQTPVGEGGRVLSGGQRQQIALARALYRNPALVVLDEPDSHLDKRAKNQLQNVLQQLGERRVTTVLVTHNTQLLQGLDKALLLERGAAKLVHKKGEAEK